MVLDIDDELIAENTEKENNEITETEMIKKEKKANKKKKKDLKTFYVVEVSFIINKFKIINRYRVIYNNKNQFLAKVKRNKVILFDNFSKNRICSNDVKYTYDSFMKNLNKIREIFIINGKHSTFYILLQRKEYSKFKNILYSLSDFSKQEEYELDFIRAAKEIKSLKSVISNEELYINSRMKHIEQLCDEKSEYVQKYKQAKKTIMNFYNDNDIPKNEKILDWIQETEISDPNWDKN